MSSSVRSPSPGPSSSSTHSIPIIFHSLNSKQLDSLIERLELAAVDTSSPPPSWASTTLGVSSSSSSSVVSPSALLSDAEVITLCTHARELFASVGNVLEGAYAVQPPVTVVGGVHGQFADLAELFRIVGRVPDTNFLFLGDFVGRTPRGVEVVCLLLALKLRFPDRIFLIRGANEGRSMSRMQGFYEECWQKFGNSYIWECFMDTFESMPFAAVIPSVAFCVNAGIPSTAHSVKDLLLIDRFRDPMASKDELLPIFFGHMSEDDEDGALPNCISRRSEVVEFLQRSGLKYVLRSSIQCMNGYSRLWNGRAILLTSAPNFAGHLGNLGAVCHIPDSDTDEIEFVSFEACPFSERPISEFHSAQMEKLERYHSVFSTGFATDPRTILDPAGPDYLFS